MQQRAFVIFLFLPVAALAFAEPPAAPKPFDRFHEIDPDAAKVDVPSLIHVRTEKDVARVRQALIEFIWKKEKKLPARTTCALRDVGAPAVLGDSAATCMTLTVQMDKGFSSLVRHLRPAKPNGKLALFHQGHADLWTGGAVETAKFFLERGYSVLAFEMPLLGENKKLAPLGFNGHGDMAKLEDKEFQPISLFLEPVAVSLNHVLERYKYDDVVMVGLSGGGWTTTLYAALDPRVRLSCPVAGTLPDYLRKKFGGDVGDWEQWHAPLYQVANYLDLYVLGAHGAERKQRQILNQYDSCCFAGVGYRTYEKHIAKTMADVGAGAFDVFLDDTHKDHLVSKHVLEKAIGPMLDEPRKK